ncbi:anthranilate phosphoribosyltransferase [Verrucomicrobiota bacterium]
MTHIQNSIKSVLAGNTLSQKEAFNSIKEIMNGEATDAQIGAFIAATRMAGITPALIAGAAQAMRNNMRPVKSPDPITVDIVGTGGDGAHTFNISTSSAFVIAGAGVTVAKHGSYGVSSKCGSANVQSELGINIQYSPEKMEEALEKIGIAFLFAPGLHPAMKNVIGPRRELGAWSLFNILGPLCNPASARYGMLGVFSEELVPVVADACIELDMKHVYVVHGQDGLDELSISAPSTVTLVKDGKTENMTVTPEEFGLKTADIRELVGGEPAENAQIVRDLFSGKIQGPKRDVVLLNSAFAIVSAGKAETIEEGIKAAALSIDSGAALSKLDQLVELSNS